ncbi:hypothetical protein G6F37_002725 [Rhizopus arrhizus]|nr:hypothetical protein G6F38_003067 [Rhizopus arrhizus]KAG1161825.1 hypothetical protein G6F37_002725 [Rhizopus arrhizus]
MMRVRDLMDLETPDNDDSGELGHAFFVAEINWFELMIDEHYNAKYAALLIGIKVRTTQIYLKMYNNDAERRLPGTYNNPRGRPLYLNLNSAPVIWYKAAIELLLFVDQRLKSGQQTPDLDFSKNYVFVDEASFNLHIQRNRGRSEKWQPAKGIAPTGKGVSFALLGAISQDDIIDITMRKFQAASGSKMRKIDGS